MGVNLRPGTDQTGNEGMSAKQNELEERLFSLGRDVLSQDVDERDRRGAVDAADWRALWQAAADAGVLGLVLPTKFGGAGRSTLTAIRALHRLGEGCRDNGMLLALNAQIWPMQMSILEFGEDAQKQTWLPRLIDGSSVCAHAVTEAGAGSSAMSMCTRAERTANGYRLTGEKTWIGMGPVADVAQVFAVTNPDHGSWGVSAFLVELDQSGIRRDLHIEKTGHRTVPTGRIEFDGVEIPASALLGSEGAGQSIFNRSIEWERRFIFASHLGAMKRQLDEAVVFARNRAPGGISINTHQSITNRLADMQVRYETSRLLIEKAAIEVDQRREDRMTPSLVKLAVSEALLANAEAALRIRGGEGYATGETERMFRDMAGTVSLGGTSDIQRQMIAALQSIDLN